jgi:hypothetical protein
MEYCLDAMYVLCKIASYDLVKLFQKPWEINSRAQSVGKNLDS